MDPTPRTVFWRIVAVCAGLRVAFEAIGLASLAAHGQPVWSNAIEFWNRWDAHHYLRIASVGYVTESPPPNTDDPLYIVFFPFFPLAVAAVALIVRNLVLSGLLVSFAASVGATWFLYRIVRLDAEHERAWRAVLLLLAFPTAYFIAAPYTEALFLFAVVGSMYAARTGRWARAGLAGALATGTRVTGIALIPGLVAEALSRPARGLESVKRLAAVAFVGVGLALYLAINLIVHDDPLWFLHVQRSHWFQYAVPPWEPIVTGVRALAEGVNRPDELLIYGGRLAGFVVALPFLVLGIRRLRVADSIYAWSGFILILSASWLISLPRYLLVLYPLFVVGADLVSSRRVLYPVLAVSSALQFWFFWRFAAGAWTF